MQRGPAAPERSGSNRQQLTRKGQPSNSSSLPSRIRSRHKSQADLSKRRHMTTRHARRPRTDLGRPRKPASSILPRLLPITMQVVGNERVRGRLNAA